MQVGVSDDSAPEVEANFQVTADGVAKGGATVKVGQVKSIDANIAGALRVRLEVDASKCDIHLGLIDAVVVPAS
ncbi:hypothetical protein ADK67_27785 [Saccharothrix sp. NRRL B-16348]|nr:hypothetical protein ADK67_27785 [Saccharothrix sp. NRRL B-16348]